MPHIPGLIFALPIGIVSNPGISTIIGFGDDAYVLGQYCFGGQYGSKYL